MIITQTERSTYLYTDPSGKQTALTKMEKGASLPKHEHVGLEQSYVLEGTLVDDDGACTAGNCTSLLR